MDNIVPELLASNNYATWSDRMKSYLVANDLWDVVVSTAGPSDPQVDEAKFEVWRRKNAEALHAIQVSCNPTILLQIKDITSAQLCWDTLAQMDAASKVTPQLPTNQGPEDHVHLRKLREAIEKGDVAAVNDIIRRHPDSAHKRIADFGKTALHAAASTGNTKIVQALVDAMSEVHLEMVGDNGETALCTAAQIGSTKIAEIMVTKNKNVVSVGVPAKGLYPVTVACQNGHRETTLFLYSHTPFDLLRPEHGSYGSLLLHETITRQMFDISLDLLRRCPSLATTVNYLKINPLHEFSGLRDYFPSGSRFNFFQRWIYTRIQVQTPAALDDVRISIPQINHVQHPNILLQGSHYLRNFMSKFFEFFGLKQIYDKKLTHAYALKILDCMTEHVSTIDNSELAKNGVYAAFFSAVRRGVVEVVVKMLKANRTLLSVVDGDQRGMLMLAVLHRQEEVFSLVYALDKAKHLLIPGLDRNRNNMLHIAAMLAPSDRLDRISGAALQMQRELQWYKEVESMMNPFTKEAINNIQQRPREIFSEGHRKMVEDGEKWMKETATSCTVVGALIITIMFTAAFTVPGGNDQTTGFPLFLHKKPFRIFLISDAISLFASSTSVLIFLGVLTSRYSEEDFLKSLPKKLIIGLSTLFISIAAMMVAFCATIILMLRQELNLVMPIVLLASVPVTLFILQQFPLLVDIFLSTYGPGIFDRKSKYWY